MFYATPALSAAVNMRVTVKVSNRSGKGLHISSRNSDIIGILYDILKRKIYTVKINEGVKT